LGDEARDFETWEDWSEVHLEAILVRD
jgi:hypothetical protein